MMSDISWFTFIQALKCEVVTAMFLFLYGGADWLVRALLRFFGVVL